MEQETPLSGHNVETLMQLIKIGNCPAKRGPKERVNEQNLSMVLQYGYK